MIINPIERFTTFRARRGGHTRVPDVMFSYEMNLFIDVMICYYHESRVLNT